MARQSGAGIALALGAIVGAFVLAGGGKKRRSRGTKPSNGDNGNGGNGKEPPVCAVGNVCPPGQVCIGGYCIDENKAQCPEGTEPVISPATNEVVCRPGGRGPKKKRPSQKKKKIPPGSPPKDTPSGAIVSPDCSSVSFEDGVGDTFWNAVTGVFDSDEGVGVFSMGEDIVGQIISAGYDQPMDVVQQLMSIAVNDGEITMNCFTPQSFPSGNAGDRLFIERQRLIFMKQYPQVYSWFTDLANRIDLAYFNGNRWMGVNKSYRITRYAKPVDNTLEPIILAAMEMTNNGNEPGLDFVRLNTVKQRANFGPSNPMNWDVSQVSKQWWLALNAGGAALDAMSPGLGRFFIERTPFVFQGDVMIDAIDREYTNKNIANRSYFNQVVEISNYEAYQLVNA